MIIDESPQGSESWLQARAGVITASCMSKVLSKGRGSKPSLTRLGYMRELATERITGKATQEGFKSQWMERGNEQEAESRDYYSIITGNKVDQVGLIYKDELKRIGASVDGMVGKDGLFEVKNPKLTTHIGYLLDGGMPSAYKAQCQMQMFVTNRKWVDFCSYHPESHKMLFIFREARDDDYIKMLKTETYRFIGEVDVLVKTLVAL